MHGGWCRGRWAGEQRRRRGGRRRWRSAGVGLRMAPPVEAIIRSFRSRTTRYTSSRTRAPRASESKRGQMPAADPTFRLAFEATWLDPSSGEGGAAGEQCGGRFARRWRRAAAQSPSLPCAGVLWRFQLFFYPATGEVEMVRRHASQRLRRGGVPCCPVLTHPASHPYPCPVRRQKPPPLSQARPL